MPSYNGTCHCGQTEFTVKLDDPSHILCHCNACKQLCGTDFTLNQVIPADNLKITKGEVKTYTYSGDSGKPVHCYYCPNCTTHIYHHQTVAGPNYVIRTPLLVGAKEWPASAEIYAKDQYSWQPKVAPKAFSAGPGSTEA